MSYQDFKKALEMAPKCRFYEIDEGIGDATIIKAEKLLGIKFSKQCREFYEKYNYMSFYGREIYGIDPDCLDVFVGNSVGYTLSERKESGLPEKWVLFQNDGADDAAIYMDYSQLNAEGEPRIIEAVYTNGEHLDEYDDDGFEEGEEPEGYCRYMITEVLAEDFGEYLLRLVEEELAEQNEKPKTNETMPKQETLEELLARVDRELKEDEELHRQMWEEWEKDDAFRKRFEEKTRANEEPKKKRGFRFPFFGKGKK